MQFRDRIPRVIHHTIVRIWSSSMIQRVQGALALMKTGGRCSRTLRTSSHSSSMLFTDVNPQEDDANFREFSKIAEDGPSRASRFSNTFPNYQQYSVSRLAIQNHGKAFFWDSKNCQKLTRNVGRCRAARCFQIVKNSCI